VPCSQAFPISYKQSQINLRLKNWISTLGGPWENDLMFIIQKFHLHESAGLQVKITFVTMQFEKCFYAVGYVLHSMQNEQVYCRSIYLRTNK